MARIVNKLKEKAMKYPLLALGIALMLVATPAYAAWIIFAQDTAEFEVVSTSGSPIVFSTSFDGVEIINTTTGPGSGNSTGVLKNNDGPQDLILSYNTVAIDNETDSCTDYTNDCSVEMYVGGNLAPQGYTFSMGSGQTLPISAILSCQTSSCPQQVNVTATIEQQ